MQCRTLKYTDHTGVVVEDIAFDYFKTQDILLPGGAYHYKDVVTNISLDPETGALVRVILNGLTPEEFAIAVQEKYLRALWNHAAEIAPALWEKYKSGEWALPEE